MSDSLQLYGPQHARLLCPSLSSKVCSNSNPLSCRCHPTSHPLSCLVLLLSIFPVVGSFPMGRLITSDGQCTGASDSALVLLKNIQDGFPLGLRGLVFLYSKGLSRVFSGTIVQKHQFFGSQPSLCSNSHIHTCLVKKP